MTLFTHPLIIFDSTRTQFGQVKHLRNHVRVLQQELRLHRAKSSLTPPTNCHQTTRKASISESTHIYSALKSALRLRNHLEQSGAPEDVRLDCLLLIRWIEQELQKDSENQRDQGQTSSPPGNGVFRPHPHPGPSLDNAANANDKRESAAGLVVRDVLEAQRCKVAVMRPATPPEDGSCEPQHTEGEVLQTESYADADHGRGKGTDQITWLCSPKASSQIHPTSPSQQPLHARAPTGSSDDLNRSDGDSVYQCDTARYVQCAPHARAFDRDALGSRAHRLQDSETTVTSRKTETARQTLPGPHQSMASLPQVSTDRAVQAGSDALGPGGRGLSRANIAVATAPAWCAYNNPAFEAESLHEGACWRGDGRLSSRGPFLHSKQAPKPTCWAQQKRHMGLQLRQSPVPDLFAFDDNDSDEAWSPAMRRAAAAADAAAAAVSSAALALGWAYAPGQPLPPAEPSAATATAAASGHSIHTGVTAASYAAGSCLQPLATALAFQAAKNDEGAVTTAITVDNHAYHTARLRHGSLGRELSSPVVGTGPGALEKLVTSCGLLAVSDGTCAAGEAWLLQYNLPMSSEGGGCREGDGGIPLEAASAGLQTPAAAVAEAVEPAIAATSRLAADSSGSGSSDGGGGTDAAPRMKVRREMNAAVRPGWGPRSAREPAADGGFASSECSAGRCSPNSFKRPAARAALGSGALISPVGPHLGRITSPKMRSGAGEVETDCFGTTEDAAASLNSMPAEANTALVHSIATNACEDMDSHRISSVGSGALLRSITPRPPSLQSGQMNREDGQHLSPSAVLGPSQVFQAISELRSQGSDEGISGTELVRPSSRSHPDLIHRDVTLSSGYPHDSRSWDLTGPVGYNIRRCTGDGSSVSVSGGGGGGGSSIKLWCTGRLCDPCLLPELIEGSNNVLASRSGNGSDNYRSSAEEEEEVQEEEKMGPGRHAVPRTGADEIGAASRSGSGQPGFGGVQDGACPSSTTASWSSLDPWLKSAGPFHPGRDGRHHSLSPTFSTQLLPATQQLGTHCSIQSQPQQREREKQLQGSEHQQEQAPIPASAATWVCDKDSSGDLRIRGGSSASATTYRPGRIKLLLHPQVASASSRIPQPPRVLHQNHRHQNNHQAHSFNHRLQPDRSHRKVCVPRSSSVQQLTLSHATRAGGRSAFINNFICSDFRAVGRGAAARDCNGKEGSTGGGGGGALRPGFGRRCVGSAGGGTAGREPVRDMRAPFPAPPLLAAIASRATGVQSRRWESINQPVTAAVSGGSGKVANGGCAGGVRLTPRRLIQQRRMQQRRSRLSPPPTARPSPPLLGGNMRNGKNTIEAAAPQLPPAATTGAASSVAAAAAASSVKPQALPHSVDCPLLVGVSSHSASTVGNGLAPVPVAVGPSDARNSGDAMGVCGVAESASLSGLVPVATHWPEVAAVAAPEIQPGRLVTSAMEMVPAAVTSMSHGELELRLRSDSDGSGSGVTAVEGEALGARSLTELPSLALLSALWGHIPGENDTAMSASDSDDSFLGDSFQPSCPACSSAPCGAGNGKGASDPDTAEGTGSHNHQPTLPPPLVASWSLTSVAWARLQKDADHAATRLLKQCPGRAQHDSHERGIEEGELADASSGWRSNCSVPDTTTSRVPWDSEGGHSTSREWTLCQTQGHVHVADGPDLGHQGFGLPTDDESFQATLSGWGQAAARAMEEAGMDSWQIHHQFTEPWTAWNPLDGSYEDIAEGQFIAGVDGFLIAGLAANGCTLTADNESERCNIDTTSFPPPQRGHSPVTTIATAVAACIDDADGGCTDVDLNATFVSADTPAVGSLLHLLDSPSSVSAAEAAEGGWGGSEASFARPVEDSIEGNDTDGYDVLVSQRSGTYLTSPSVGFSPFTTPRTPRSARCGGTNGNAWMPWGPGGWPEGSLDPMGSARQLPSVYDFKSPGTLSSSSMASTPRSRRRRRHRAEGYSAGMRMAYTLHTHTAVKALKANGKEEDQVGAAVEDEEAVMPPLHGQCSWVGPPSGGIGGNYDDNDDDDDNAPGDDRRYAPVSRQSDGGELGASPS